MLITINALSAEIEIVLTAYQQMMQYVITAILIGSIMNAMLIALMNTIMISETVQNVILIAPFARAHRLFVLLAMQLFQITFFLLQSVEIAPKPISNIIRIEHASIAISTVLLQLLICIKLRSTLKPIFVLINQ